MAAKYIFISILIVTNGFLVYRIQRFLWTHRTWELALVLSIFSAGTVAASQYHAMPLQVETIFYTVLCFFLILLTFEPEIAQLCSQLIQRLNPNSLNQKKSALGELAHAAVALAATKTGALIAFERNDSLLKFGETGIEINADIKKELITTLFFKDTATHDGGLLIREGRATHCGAVFPLSERKQMENGLGTRHRAALGLTEKTDAVCLIVSEEEGTISLARDGELSYAIPLNQVELKLSKLLSGSSRFRFYPFHYIKYLAPKLVQSNYIQFTKSLAEYIYEFTVMLFFIATFSALASSGIIRVSDFKEPLDLLFTRPWMFVPASLLILSIISFLGSRNVSVNGVVNEIKIQHRFLFLPIWNQIILRENLKGVTLKPEKSGTNLWSLVVFNKKKRGYLLDRGTAAKSLTEYAKKIKDVLRIDLFN